jgi:hypothetical protein
MDGESLKRWQLERIQKSLQPSMNYLHRLRRRMDNTGFVPNDRLYRHVDEAYDKMYARLYRHVDEAYDKMYALLVELHYLIVGHGVGRSPRESP